MKWVLWQEGKLPHDQLELSYRCFENTASDVIDCAAHINDEITTQEELVARLRLLDSCRLILVAVGFTVSMNRKLPQYDQRWPYVKGPQDRQQ